MGRTGQNQKQGRTPHDTTDALPTNQGIPARVEKIVLGRVAICYLATRTAQGQTVRPKMEVDYYSSTGFLQVGARDAPAGLSLLLSTKAFPPINLSLRGGWEVGRVGGE